VLAGCSVAHAGHGSDSRAISLNPIGSYASGIFNAGAAEIVATGRFEELYAFGGRSFSIWTADGKLVFDSGDDLEMITAAAYSTNFNASNSNNEFDNRSDDKGPESEGVVVGKAYGKTYAFIGLERIGGVVVYDISRLTRSL
jgi:hypothetical protein